MSKRSASLRAKSSETGAALVEFAVSFAVFSVMLTSITGYGLFLTDYLLLARVVHQGVMYGANQHEITSENQVVETSWAQATENNWDGLDEPPPLHSHADIHGRVLTTLVAYKSLGRLGGIDLRQVRVSSTYVTPDSGGGDSFRLSLAGRYRLLGFIDIPVLVEAQADVA